MLVRTARSAGRLAYHRSHPQVAVPRSSALAWEPRPKSWSFARCSTTSVEKTPEKKAVQPEPLSSWVDATDYMPFDLEDTGDEDLDKAVKLHVDEETRPQIEDALTQAGVKDLEDLQYVTESDLVKYGVAAVPARKFLSILKPPEKPAIATAASTGHFDPAATMKGLAKKGAASGARNTEQIMASSFLGGALLGFGCALTTVVAGGASPVLGAAPGLQQLLAGAIFPAGLSMVLLSGSELLTGNFVTMALPFQTHPGMSKDKITSGLVKVWALSGFGNLAGSLFLATSVYGFSVVTAGTPAAAWLCALTAKKCGLSLATMVGKAAGANWLVNVAIFQASSAYTTAGKIASLWIPIMTFVALGLEHSIANMFLLPLGWMLGADVTLAQIACNIVPVAVGNALGAIIFVGGVQRYSLLKNMVHRSK